jgi:alkanesulfonate monooxygenase SsuD/methylene tetrahydromethanopterin reductase-like flavin-dependent oxidoreductase (luciferase family)
MAEQRRGIALTPMETRREVIVEMAILADRLGYELFSVPEGWGFDSTLVLTEIALKTEQITVMSGILSVWGRTAGTIAMSAATLADISGGRYVLGLGASTKALVEGFHGIPFEKPTRRFRETVRAVRRILNGERAPVPEEVDSRPLKLGQPPRPDVPIYLAGLGPQSVRAAAQLAEGWFPYLVARDRFQTWVPDILKIRSRAGRAGDPFTVVAGPNVSVNADEAAARQVVASNLAWYVCAMGDAYANSITNQGYGDQVAAIRAANPRPSPATGEVPAEADHLLNQLAAYGPPEKVAAMVDAWDETVDINAIGIPPGLPWDRIEAIIRAAAPR